MGSLEKGNRVLLFFGGRRNKDETAKYQDGPNCILAEFNYIIDLASEGHAYTVSSQVSLMLLVQGTTLCEPLA